MPAQSLNENERRNLATLLEYFGGEILGALGPLGFGPQLHAARVYLARFLIVRSYHTANVEPQCLTNDTAGQLWSSLEPLTPVSQSACQPFIRHLASRHLITQMTVRDLKFILSSTKSNIDAANDQRLACSMPSVPARRDVQMQDVDFSTPEVAGKMTLRINRLCSHFSTPGILSRSILRRPSRSIAALGLTAAVEGFRATCLQSLPWYDD